MPSAVLYTFPFSCSLAVDLVLAQHGVQVERRYVRRGSARKVDADLPRRKVPVLELDGERLVEIVAILDALDRRFVPDRSAAARRRHLEWAAFIATELHQQVLGPWYDPATPDAARLDARDRLLPPVLADLEAGLAERTLLGGPPTGADAYALWGSLLVGRMEVPLGPRLAAFRSHMLGHGWVRSTIAAHAA